RLREVPRVRRSRTLARRSAADRHRRGPDERDTARVTGARLVVVSGLPATGKSALADALGRELHAAVLSVDPIEAAIMRGGIPTSSETGVAAYEVVAVLAAHHLGLGLPVVVDAVSSLEVAREMWRRAATLAGARMRVVEIVCSDESAHRARLAARRRDI